jgi:nucleotide-binding universal stress UspA family protein
MIIFAKILVPVDFGDSSKHALAVAVDLAKQHGGTLTLLHCWELPAYAYNGMDVPVLDLLTPIRDAARAQLDELLATVRRQVPDAKGVLAHGAPWREIMTVIEQSGPDLVVMGTHGRRGLGRAFLGSVAEKVVRMSPSPVLTVRASEP